MDEGKWVVLWKVGLVLLGLLVFYVLLVLFSVALIVTLPIWGSVIPAGWIYYIPAPTAYLLSTAPAIWIVRLLWPKRPADR